MIDCTTMFIPTIARELGLAPTALTQCIACLQDGKPVAGALYEGYNTYTISAHIWIKEGKRPDKEWYAAIFDYPFNQLGVNKILGQVASSNTKAKELDEHLGFTVEAVIKDYSPDGDLLMYTMTKEQCRILNSPLWTKPLKLVQS